MFKNKQENMKDLKKVEAILLPALEIMPNNIKLLSIYAICLQQWDMNHPENPTRFWTDNK